MSNTTYSDIYDLHEQAFQDELVLSKEIDALYSVDEVLDYQKARGSERKLSKFFNQTHGNWKTCGCGNAPKGSREYLMSLHRKSERLSTLRFSCTKVMNALRGMK